MKKQINKKLNGQLQLSFDSNSSSIKSHVSRAKIIHLKEYQQKSFIGFILKNSKPF